MNNNNNRGRRDADSGSDRPFSVHISDEDYEREMSGRSSSRRRDGYGGAQSRRSERSYDGRQRDDRAYDGRRAYDDRQRDGRAYNDRQRDGRIYDSRAYDERPRDARAYDDRSRREVQSSASRSNHGCLNAVLYAAFVLAVSALLSVFLISGFNDMLGLVKDDVQITVTIPSDADLKTVTRILGDESVVKHPTLFRWYSEFTNREEFIPGTFEVNSKADYDLLIRILTSPYGLGQKTVMVTIPEGLNVEQIAELLESKYVCKSDKFFASLETHQWKHSFFPSIPADKEGRKYRMEGYLFPSTYEFYIKGDSLYAANRMLNGFNDRVLKSASVDFDGHIASLNEKYSVIGGPVDMDFIITMASIIEREAQTPEDMRKVASVFYNRLKNADGEGINGRLESDATMWYPYPTETAMRASETLTEEQKNAYAAGNPYNTHNIQGLPPGPICCPGLNSINAALNPDDTKYLYFFSDRDGNFHFAETYSGFTKLIEKYGV